MNLAAILVLIGVILAGIDLVFAYGGRDRYHAGLLNAAVLLIGIGVLMGPVVH